MSSGRTPSLATQVQQQQQSSEPSLQFPTREFLDKNFHKVDLQNRCRELGLTKIWVTKDQLIEMIVKNTPPPAQNPETNQTVSSPRLSPGNQLRYSNINMTPSAPPVDISLDVDQQLITFDSQPTHTNGIPPPVTPAPATQPNSIGDVEWTPSAELNQAPPANEPLHSPVVGTQTSSASSNSREDLQEGTSLLKISRDIEAIMSKLETKDNEIDLLSTEVKTAYTIIEHLQQRINELELQTKTWK